MKTSLIVVALYTVTATWAVAGPVNSACQKSSRATSSMLCDCIQQVANATLTGSDQRLAAKIFRDPEMAQDIRQSDRASHRAFWARYTIFGATAERTCTN